MKKHILKNKSSQIDLSVYIKSFVLLMKPRVMSLVLFTAMVGLLVAPVTVSFTTASLSLLAVAIGSGAAGALNMWYESDVDALMSRTCLRPIPAGKVKRKEALLFGIILSFISIVMLYLSSNLISIDKKLSTGKFDVLAMVHNETSTGVMSNLEEISILLKSKIAERLRI